ncbi:VirB8 family type IV secretion system protein [Verminephrobacter eiseniae]|uniref:Bacterial virulence protein VirB8 domain-containing protein n=1 Tax=Verminephrobacter eiseniae (strain EF01-2) TaxID=391735 RepID=A1WP55_VEREI|nr:type IV secretion system protein [Verminephrobacter eiseniae]ABM59412.1 hypothetical protein Veis_3697 [Verminephrobacter eiseniae EF01-2]MCW5284936.1 type IV secretion system protein [Verminephrobacter eiseniae]MCW5302644.1 type IV secretion system protein [Verminephrobacter eiseniae]MCW8179470.1 type IV secretion system protein [Verminephrobacter eiseniae]MCW8189027.1 type IV secretion system protein [Verminephrobacter eiseniae]
MKPKGSRLAPPDHVPGPMEQAAAQAYFERGSSQAMGALYWRMTAIVCLLIVLVMAALATVIASRQEVAVMQVSKDMSGELQVVGVARAFSPDEDSKMAWAASYAQTLTEVTPAIWRRNVDRLVRLSTGVALDQARSYLHQQDTNPAALLDKNPLYVREFHRKSVNKVTDDTYLVRYDLVSRPQPNTAPSTKSFSMSLTLTSVGHKRREDVFNNPAGLAALNFSISEETGNQ